MGKKPVRQRLDGLSFVSIAYLHHFPAVHWFAFLIDPMNPDR